MAKESKRCQQYGFAEPEVDVGQRIERSASFAAGRRAVGNNQYDKHDLLVGPSILSG